MTKKEAAIVSAYTGYLVGSFSEMHGYVEKLLGEPVFTHQFGNKDFMEMVREKVKPDYVSIEVIN